MKLEIPRGHQPRYSNFDLTTISDETIREGLERALFGASDHKKLQLVEKLAEAGIKDIDMGSGIYEPNFLLRCLHYQNQLGRIPKDVQFVFNLTLQSWEPISKTLKIIPRDYLSKIQVSLGMVEYKEEENLLAKAHEELSRIGIKSFRSSILNAFGMEVDEEQYTFISRQINRVKQLGITLVRINDSIGTLYPDTTAILAANLVNDFPEIEFYLHSHDDRGLGLANSLASIFHGFNIVEGGVAGFGNRAGLANIEVLCKILIERNITVKGKFLNIDKLCEAATLAERTFLVTPNVYRPVSGYLVETENAGIVNVPDYLNAQRRVTYFLNQIGLFNDTISKILANSGFSEDLLQDSQFLDQIRYSLMEYLDNKLLPQKQKEYDVILDKIKALYENFITLDDVQNTALDILQQRALNDMT